MICLKVRLYCLSLPKLSFLLRGVDTSGHVELLQNYDRVTREALTRILGTPVARQNLAAGKAPGFNGWDGFEMC